VAESFRIFLNRFSAAAFSGFDQRQPQSRRGSDLNADMELSLNDVFHGATKMVTLDGQKVNLKIAPGTRDGQILRMKGKGSPGSGGAANGDLLITVRLLKDHHYDRRGDDLYFDQSLDVVSAMLGGQVAIKGFDKTVSMKIPAGTDSNRVFRLKGMGVPLFENPSTRGDAYVKMIIRIPKDLSDEEKKLLEEFAELRKKETSH